MSSHVRNQSRVVPLRPVPAEPERAPEPAAREPLWRDVVGDVLRRERLAQDRTLKDVADEARISMPYLSEVERGRKEASSEVLAAAAHALGLRLADLLLLVHGELAAREPARVRSLTSAVRPASRTAAGPRAGTDALLLAA
ncbi:helix-turn-helix domain-containing protein [Streptomyces minutiscleroticus]|uniref:HTH cro/C1-type domain-containing protein n=1 Tax=Streptomyces minutiscleroticus TaxID=68238 RepID=A0A918KSU2_9ACTN|nr:helix-turn-helix transcriptional regulator [Streptomyces minutiscleroticus]GGX75820.1 hypothetical protein GCM10010358_32710 [Streptomyces minutiscleroticus]